MSEHTVSGRVPVKGDLLEFFDGEGFVSGKLLNIVFNVYF